MKDAKVAYLAERKDAILAHYVKKKDAKIAYIHCVFYLSMLV